MSNIPSKTQIGEVECSGCGATVPLKVNVNQCVYYFCARVLARDENGKATSKCMTRFNLGLHGSKPIIDEYLSLQGEKQDDVKKNEIEQEPSPDTGEINVEPEGGGIEPDYTGENITPEDEPIPAPPKSRGIFGGIFEGGTAFD